jgi:hypothetical protein
MKTSQEMCHEDQTSFEGDEMIGSIKAADMMKNKISDVIMIHR